MTDQPWAALAVPESAPAINVRRVSATGTWNFFWGRDSDGRSLLVMKHGIGAAPSTRFPRLRGIEVLAMTDVDGPSLVLRLRDGTLRDPFHTLCLDIIDSAEKARDEPEAVAVAVGRTWRWHHLLRGGGSDILSPEEQKGLIGELLVLEKYFLGHVPVATAVEAWHGPLGAARDFELDAIAIESKALGKDSPLIRVSSEFQLDGSERETLFLHLVALHRPEDHEEGFTLTEVVERVRRAVADLDHASVARLDGLLTAAGFRSDDDYTGDRWRGGERGIFRVAEGFPRLIPTMLPAGVTGVTYTIATDCLIPFVETEESVIAAISRVNDDD